MTTVKITTGLFVLLGFSSMVNSQISPKGNLILCDCGIGDDKEHPDWSTSRQMNWYDDIKWPASASTYPEAPDMAVEIPYKDGIYPWIPRGATGTMPNGQVWTAYVEDGTPDGFKAGNAVSSKDGKDKLNCWAYHGRPVSAAVNKTISHDAICWTAFVCNHNNNPPPRPKDMDSHSSSAPASTAPPKTTFYTKPPKTVTVTSTTSGQPAPTSNPKQGQLEIYAGVNPRFINWQDTWQAFINLFVWDKNTGRCISGPVRGQGFNITIECAGIQIDEDSHMTLLLIKALRDVGLKSLWFNQNPIIPGGTNSNQTASNWVVMPEAFSLRATDVATNKLVGRLSYKTHYDAFLATPCSTCDNARFNQSFFDPIISAVEGSYPKFNNFTVQAQCDPWIACD
ncbi:hypothetical protein E4U30_006545 [Claviceps sp. LM220 group G6]|nr:hypothetical protein E4U30_006545 [Claviceps sp. LM220 group G6]KAG6097032.1 hypothetical protein E4U14_007842 [Claviceps sp. LM454 group G7]KAG6114239.1 hypothetical protein E4U31_005810 [Claviceps sp. LM219 group G6]